MWGFSPRSHGNSSFVGVRRETDVWGEDAHQFNPERWLTASGKRASSVGVYSNLYVISSWRSVEWPADRGVLAGVAGADDPG